MLHAKYFSCKLLRQSDAHQVRLLDSWKVSQCILTTTQRSNHLLERLQLPQLELIHQVRPSDFADHIHQVRPSGFSEQFYCWPSTLLLIFDLQFVLQTLCPQTDHLLSKHVFLNPRSLDTSLQSILNRCCPGVLLYSGVILHKTATTQHLRVAICKALLLNFVVMILSVSTRDHL